MFKIILSKSKNKFICFISSIFIMLVPNIVSADTVNILGLFPFSGPYADSGKLLDEGAQIALEEVGYEVNGKKIKYITRDSETKAGPAARRAQEAIDTEGVNFIVGPWSSGVALAVTEVAKKNKVMYLSLIHI
mgnify:FL=1